MKKCCQRVMRFGRLNGMNGTDPYDDIDDEDFVVFTLRGPDRIGIVSRSPACCSRLATTHHSFLGSFSAVSKRNFGTKYASFQVFRDLQNYLADFFKKLQNFAKNRKKCKIFMKFPDFSRKSVDFCENH